MGTANVISLFAQPLHASYLCFEIGGILEARHAELGEAVKFIHYQKICDYLKLSKTLPADASRLKWDSREILDFAKAFAIATLRNEDRKAALDSAVNSRQNLYFSKYANAASVISTIKANYYRLSPASKPNLLNRLSDIAQDQMVALHDAYTEDDRTGVVRETTSSIESITTSSGGARRAAKFYQESVGRNRGRGARLPSAPPLPWEGYPKNPGDADHTWGGYPSKQFTAAEGTGTALTTGVNWEDSDHNGRESGTQSATHVDYEYRTPLLEAQARNLRAQVSLRDQKFELFMFEQNIPHLEAIFQNELASIDNDVYQLQIALLRSILIAPVSGIVTGVYKNPGDAVNAGEPVIRVEDNRTVQLVANLMHDDPIAIGATATVTTTVGGGSKPPTTVTGKVVAARGQVSGRRWEVVVNIDNVDGGGNYLLPLGYCFDPEYTGVTVV